MICHCDYEQPSFYRTAAHKARKAHECYECGGVIAAGERYEYVTGVWEGEFRVYKTCAKCVALRTWVTAHIPCACWGHGQLIADLRDSIEAVYDQVPKDDAKGLWFGFLRRLHAIKRPTQGNCPESPDS